MTKLAVDVAILPPSHIMGLSIELNKHLKDGAHREIELDGQSCLPHISLAMGTLDKSDLKKVENALIDIATHTAPLQLSTAGVSQSDFFCGKTVSSLEIEKSDKLLALHNLVTTRMASLFSHDAKKEYFFPVEGQDVIKSNIDCVNNFHTKHSFEQFSPHITLGYGTVGLEQEVCFEATRLALCQLGNHCTCRKILCEFRLGE